MTTRIAKSKKVAVAAGLGAVATAVGLSVCSGVSPGVAQAGLNAPVPLIIKTTTTTRPHLFGEGGVIDKFFDRFHNDDPVARLQK